LGVLLAALGPLWAAFEGVVPRTLAGLLVLAAAGPAFVALVAATDTGLRWSGRQEVLGTLEFSALRLAIAMVAAVIVVASLALFGTWFVRSSTAAPAVSRFLADNFR
jgi:hypothetical protein